ncbi:pyrrolidone-carboxylate peptidase [Alicyclobacillus hesperidum URH17-3-68]|uniref:Pyrrolidone-carboxylate peptidase n=1 Tax=Alicyclobacillus hesperidum TaxID=89784 RepID=A0A1H2TSG8_9BACL|nr:pyrrolidone-carboxylate peptidase [Alicyclobacillus hesperidum URH17-3-68]GLV13980.1 pyrrolidone-carboxylate peptidase [Alicyclobacillus hesperidum]SDW46727.1 pyroglutamyl-peptidase I Cysteine peptidase. MEROPS family C15 [Alicyclobacillus hesperidum]
METVLLTGFEPFQGEVLNPSWEIARTLSGETLANRFRIVAKRLPTAFSTAADELYSAIESVHPRAVICLGEAGGRTQLTPERVAINIIDARIPDNQGAQPQDEPISQDGPVGYFSLLPLRPMVEAIQAVGVPAAISDTAGTFVCNYVFYTLMHHIHTHNLQIAGGFMHVPYMTEQVLAKKAPGLPLDLMAKGVRAAVEAVVQSFPERPTLMC